MKEIATWIRPCDELAFARMFAPYPGVRLHNARVEKIPPRLHALLLTGGEDISQKFLRQPVPNPGLIQDPDPIRDAWEFPLLQRALRQRLPVFAICRGMQLLNVALGGTLHLHLPGHDASKFDNIQPLDHEPAAEIQIPRVNSSHHQALDQLAPGLRVEARHRHDRTIEQVRLENYPYALGVQYHPERHEIYRPLFDRFVAEIMQQPEPAP